MTPDAPRYRSTELIQVRWTRAHWQPDRDGNTRWHLRWFTLRAPALRLARRLADDGAEVVVDTWRAEWKSRGRMPDDYIDGPARARAALAHLRVSSDREER